MKFILPSGIAAEVIVFRSGLAEGDGVCTRLTLDSLIVYSARSLCKPPDVFDWHLGCRLAAKHLLTRLRAKEPELLLSKDDRRAIYNAVAECGAAKYGVKEKPSVKQRLLQARQDDWAMKLLSKIWLDTVHDLV